MNTLISSNNSISLKHTVFYLLLATISVAPFSISLYEIVSSFLFFAWIIKLIRDKKRLEIPPLGWFFLIYLFISILSAMNSHYSLEAFKGVWNVARYTLIFFLVINTVHSLDQVKKILWILAVSTSLWALAGMIYHSLFLQKEFFTLVGFFSLGNKHAVAQYLQMTLSILIGVFLTHSFPRGEMALLVIAILVCLLAFFLSGAKTMWLVFIIILVLYAFLCRSHKLFAGIGILLILFFIMVGLSSPVKTLATHISQGPNAPSMQERYLGWKQSYAMFRDHPILGVGPKCYFPASKNYQIIENFGQAHNMIIHVAIEMGLIGVGGLIAWIAYYIYFIATYRKTIPHPIFLGLWLAGVAYFVTLGIGGLTDVILGGEYSLIFMLLAGLLQTGKNLEAGDWQKERQGTDTREFKRCPGSSC